MNVVSTSPSGTEILCALGIDPVAVSHACDYPPRVEDLPSIDFSRVRGGSSAERHDRVRTVSAEGTVYRLDVGTLRDAEPDLILSQEVCGVCAVDTTLVDEVLGDLDGDPDVVGLDANELEDLFSCIERVGEAVGREKRAGELNATLRDRLAGIEARTEGLDRPRVAVLEWLDPLIAAGNWVPELVEIAGGEYGLAEPGDRTVEVEWPSVVEYDPEVLVAAPCGFDVEATIARSEELTEREGWAGLSAARNGRAYAMDGASYLNRWSPRLVDAAERLAACCHPEEFGEPPEDVERLR
ncbi:ABC transporter substrate-binding protein [Halalkalicoccus subterraneus]|uniref:ABC transporter substrate-binding protein n=1 Tax=Halalkalicoccus subterraneus TaxID=2675002 RepID=UPI000EFD2C34|nr:ABC transporter substrate-binding protein [Halalkalicoccus subterraneus]